MISTLARQTAVVLVEKLPDDFDRFNLFQPVQRIKTAEVWQCFHANQGLKVVQQPASSICVYPYTIIDCAGWCMPRSETYSLERAIAYCDLCIANIPEFSDRCFIPNAISPKRMAEITNTICEILELLNEEFPELEELERVQ